MNSFYCPRSFPSLCLRLFLQLFKSLLSLTIGLLSPRQVGLIFQHIQPIHSLARSLIQLTCVHHLGFCFRWDVLGNCFICHICKLFPLLCKTKQVLGSYKVSNGRFWHFCWSFVLIFSVFDLDNFNAQKSTGFPQEFYGWSDGKAFKAVRSPRINSLQWKWVLLNFSLIRELLKGQTQISGGSGTFIPPFLTITIDVQHRMAGNEGHFQIVLRNAEKLLWTNILISSHFNSVVLKLHISTVCNRGKSFSEIQ